jgi:hypothetical protein
MAEQGSAARAEPYSVPFNPPPLPSYSSSFSFSEPAGASFSFSAPSFNPFAIHSPASDFPVVYAVPHFPEVPTSPPDPVDAEDAVPTESDLLPTQSWRELAPVKDTGNYYRFYFKYKGNNFSSIADFLRCFVCREKKPPAHFPPRNKKTNSRHVIEYAFPFSLALLARGVSITLTCRV